MLGKFKDNQSKQGEGGDAEKSNADKSKLEKSKVSAKSANNEEEGKKKKKPERGAPMVARRLRAKQHCQECGQECYMFSNMRFYDCDFII